ncbi:Vacuolar-sorting protein SNF7 [Ascosphaera pollenicola]|nr:Vacuolar-sorting protein SNF7 [Ascosphaera pollenicola]
MGMRDPLLEAMAEIKVNGNQLRKQALKAESMSKSQETKATNAIKKGQVPVARIHAGAATRERKRHFHLLQKAAEADVIYSDLLAAKSTRDSTRSLMKASRAMENASRSINLERTLAIANQFVSRSEEFKIAGSTLEGVSRDVEMQADGADEAEDEVDKLMERLADQAGVDLRQNLESNQVPEGEAQQQQAVRNTKQKDPEFEDGLAGRLRALRT